MALLASISLPAPTAADVAAAAMLTLLLGLELLLSEMLEAEGTAHTAHAQQMTGGVIRLDTDAMLLLMVGPVLQLSWGHHFVLLVPPARLYRL